MSIQKQCPLLSITSEDSFVQCQKELCAWYVPDANPFKEGRCAVQALGALPELAQEVRGL